MEDSHSALIADLGTLVQKWKKRYGVIPTVPRVDADSLTLHGNVVTYDQLNEVRELANRHGGKVAVKALQDPLTAPPLGYFLPLNYPLNVWRSPDFGKLTSQVVPDDGPMRGLAAVESSAKAMLVQCDDRTLGWVASDGITCCPDSKPNVALLEKDQIIPSSPPTEMLWSAAAHFLGVPYVLGGKSESGIDCSGLVSRVVRSVSGVVLPRHSTLQMRCGVRVSLRDIQSGDLVFARLNHTGIAHVALLLDRAGAGPMFVHASQTRGRVVCESDSEFYADYRFMAARRLWKHEVS